ncbi:Dioxygenase swnH1 [Fusarium oxysporum f. sp. conglutinans]|nr:Dioxygenase swnH1 [Fusarium oxysporum f. sp. conglutinans]
MCSSSTHPTEAGTAISTLHANDTGTTADTIINALERDGALIVKSIASKSLCEQIRSDLKPLFDSDVKDDSGFFPPTTKRATGFFATSDACVELAINPLFQSVAEKVLGSKYTYWEGQEQLTVFGKPYIASAVGFRVEPGGKQQALHRDDSDYHPRNCDMPVTLGCVTALTKTTKENDEEAIPGELEIGDAMLFLGNVYHAGGANITKDDARETVGIFMCKGTLRQEENQYLSIPPEVAKTRNFPPRMLRLLGYGICPPALGFYKYRDPMKVIFGIEDEETVKK